jgi:cytoskeleton protein RodZ
MSFGANLKRERELRGISLEEISKATKISARLLEAIEIDRYDLLPGGIFRRSFIRSYAKYLGMNEDKVLQEYTLVIEAASPPAQAEEKLPGGRSPTETPSRQNRITIGIIMALLLAGAGYWHFSRNDQGNRSENVPVPVKTVTNSSPIPGSPSPSLQSPVSSLPLSVNPSAVPTVSVPPAGMTTAPPTSTVSPIRVLGELAKKTEAPPAVEAGSISAESNPEGLILGIDATEQCWLSVVSGDATLYKGLLYPQQTKKFPLQKGLKLTMGNAGGIKLSVNGQPFIAVGKLGEVRVLEIRPDNYQGFLTSTSGQ